ncbi:hypothetical protein [Sediminicurvatus halobius]|nr:hypothetical protein [Spiribacter halobius]
MHPALATYIGCRLMAGWHLALARAWLRAAGGLGPLPQARVLRLEVRRG